MYIYILYIYQIWYIQHQYMIYLAWLHVFLPLYGLSLFLYLFYCWCLLCLLHSCGLGEHSYVHSSYTSRGYWLFQKTNIYQTLWCTAGVLDKIIHLFSVWVFHKNMVFKIILPQVFLWAVFTDKGPVWPPCTVRLHVGPGPTQH